MFKAVLPEGYLIYFSFILLVYRLILSLSKDSGSKLDR